MSTAIDRARADAAKAAAKLEELEAQEAAKLAEEEVQRQAGQRELDLKFLSGWAAMDAALMNEGTKSAADVIYEGGDVLQAVAHFHVQRARRNAVRQHARDAYYRVHGTHPDDTSARELTTRDMRLADRLEEAIHAAASRHAADLADKLEAEFMVEGA
ncbi:hypothetical protein ACFU6I_46400 [Streptomyces sp. NPDC057486]|uniref:hypothetical protein n=1 Tax=Streptomyces sp. NPDC057486 TaxID=3346145 RepID=UPI00369AE701